MFPPLVSLATVDKEGTSPSTSRKIAIGPKTPFVRIMMRNFQNCRRSLGVQEIVHKPRNNTESDDSLEVAREGGVEDNSCPGVADG